jgi:hypothetical protein
MKPKTLEDLEKNEEKRKKFEFLDRVSLRKAFHVVRPSGNQQNPQQNQHGPPQSQSYRKKHLEKVEKFEDILLKLCEKANTLLKCRYAAVSLYTNTNTPMNSDVELSSYLKAQASQRLIKISNNLLCCDPILKSQRVLLVKDATSSNAPYFNKTMQPFEYDFKQMPIVIGPQKARFYAGTPLIDSQQNILGAICVFDSVVREEMPSQQVLDQLQDMVEFAVKSIEARKTFGAAPFTKISNNSSSSSSSTNRKKSIGGMRQTEPTFKLNRNIRRLEEPVDQVGDEEERRRTEVVAGGHSLAFLQDEGIETYKKQMRRLVLQAQRTQAQMEENALSIQDFQITQM